LFNVIYFGLANDLILAPRICFLNTVVVDNLVRLIIFGLVELAEKLLTNKLAGPTRLLMLLC